MASTHVNMTNSNRLLLFSLIWAWDSVVLLGQSLQFPSKSFKRIKSVCFRNTDIYSLAGMKTSVREKDSIRFGDMELDLACVEQIFDKSQTRSIMEAVNVLTQRVQQAQWQNKPMAQVLTGLESDIDSKVRNTAEFKKEKNKKRISHAWWELEPTVYLGANADLRGITVMNQKAEFSTIILWPQYHWLCHCCFSWSLPIKVIFKNQQIHWQYWQRLYHWANKHVHNLNRPNICMCRDWMSCHLGSLGVLQGRGCWNWLQHWIVYDHWESDNS